jgi:nitronate monooxygenase
LELRDSLVERAALLYGTTSSSSSVTKASLSAMSMASFMPRPAGAHRVTPKPSRDGLGAIGAADHVREGRTVIPTRFTALVGCATPIQQAGMGAAAPPELAAAVSNAGAFGMLGTARPGLSLATLNAMLDRLQALTTRVFGVNFLVRPGHGIDGECFEAAAKRARLVEFVYGKPDPELVAVVHDQGALAAWQIGSREEAIAAAKAGCDLVIAQGIEAGGHVRGTIGLLPLLSEVREEVDLPVIAAGGIGTGESMAAALVAGADGVRIGTRFVAAAEAGAHPAYVPALVAASAGDTVYTDRFAVGWPDAPHRAAVLSRRGGGIRRRHHGRAAKLGRKPGPRPPLGAVRSRPDNDGNDRGDVAVGGTRGCSCRARSNRPRDRGRIGRNGRGHSATPARSRLWRSSAVRLNGSYGRILRGQPSMSASTQWGHVTGALV